MELYWRRVLLGSWEASQHCGEGEETRWGQGRASHVPSGEVSPL